MADNALYHGDNLNVLRRHWLRATALLVVVALAALAGILTYRHSTSWPNGTLTAVSRSTDGIWVIRTYYAETGLGPDAAVFWVVAHNLRSGTPPRIVYVGDDSTEARFSNTHTIRVIEYDTDDVVHLDLRTAKTVALPGPSPLFWFDTAGFQAAVAVLTALGVGAVCVIVIPLIVTSRPRPPQ